MIRYVKSDGPKDRQTFAELRAEFQDGGCRCKRVQ
jgi:hypothetical protein